MLSIIVPIYNCEKYIDRCISSLVGQTYRDLEIILVNDGSKDASLQLCRAWVGKDDRIIVIDKSNGGVSETRNIGLDHVRGDYIAFVDADDYVDHDMYDKLIRASQMNDADLVFCQYDKFDESGRVVFIDEAQELKGLESKNVIPFIYNGDKSNVGGFVWRSLFRSSLVRDLRFPAEQAEGGVAVGEDVIFLLKAIYRARRISFLDEFLYHYYQPTDWSCKYVLNDNYSVCMRRFILALKEVLYAFGRKQLADSQDFHAYDLVVSQYIAYRKNYRRDLKHLLRTDLFYREATQKEKIEQYKKVYKIDNFKKHIRLFLLRRRMFFAYKVLRNLCR